MYKVADVKQPMKDQKPEAKKPLIPTMKTSQNIFGSLLILGTMLLSEHRSDAAFQPMLLSPGTFSIQAGANVIQIAAQCLDRSLEVPEAGHAFDQFSDGIKVARVLGNSRETVTLEEAIKRGWVTPEGTESIDNVGFTVNEEETKKGAKFEIKVSDASPQFVATGTSQVSDVKKLLTTGGDVIANADRIVASFLNDDFPAWKEFFGTDFPGLFAIPTEELTSFLKQRLVWAVRGTSNISAGDGVRLLSQQFGKELGIPLTAPDLAGRLELVRGTKLTATDYQLLNKLTGRTVEPAGDQYKTYVKIVKSNDEFQITYQGDSNSFDTLEGASKTLRRKVPPPSRVIFDSDDIPPLSEEEAQVLLQHGFHYVTDEHFFLEHGPIKKPNHVIVIASDDSDLEAQETANKVIFGGQSTGDLSSISSALKSKLGDSIKFVTTKQQLINELSKANAEGDLPIVLGHNDSGKFNFADGDNVDIGEMPYSAVPFSCSLFKVHTEQLPVVTTEDFEVRNLLSAIGDAFTSKNEADFLSSLVGAYDQRCKRQGALTTAVGVIGLGGIAYAVNCAGSTNNN